MGLSSWVFITQICYFNKPLVNLMMSLLVRDWWKERLHALSAEGKAAIGVSVVVELIGE